MTEHPASVANLLRRGVATLRAAGIEDPELEAEVLLRHALGLTRAHLFARLPAEVDEGGESRYRECLRRRLMRVPVAYITGHREFYDLDLAVAPGVLIPRPETEHVVETVLRLGRQMLEGGRPVTCVDAGTGSGAIALAIARHLPAARVLATDQSEAALAMAGFNAKRLRLAGRITFLLGDLLQPLMEPVDIIAANLPYIPTATIDGLQPEVRDHEPRMALDGGSDGLRVIARLLGQAPRHLRDEGAIVLEIGHDQAAALEHEAAGLLPGAAVTFEPDLAGFPRVAVVQV